ncbi:hypothetical protein B484DRAFT_448188 [Ochromonadaceae sp. CCMP2298]|nr:hypothetical protein B484DRAFT_448188 [Ochromonadaceae sp. CCMP2298]
MHTNERLTYHLNVLSTHPATMSTKMSTDMNITRPTSRVIRPPGGGSSFSISGGYDADPAPTATPAKKQSNGPANSFTHSHDALKPAEIAAVAPPAAPAPVAPASPVKAKAAPAPAPVYVAPTPVTGIVGIIVAGELAPEAITAAVTKALAQEGITGSVISYVPEASIAPFAAKKMSASVDCVIVAAIMIEPSMRSALLNLNSADVPVIPGVVVQGSLLEAKAMLASSAASWAKAAASVLAMKAGELVIEVAPVVVIEEPVVLTTQVSDPALLMTVLRQTLKAHGAYGISGLSRKFRIMDDNNSSMIDLSEFTKGMAEHALDWTADQIKAVFEFFDSDKSGGIDIDEFLFGVRGTLNERRSQLVLMAFEILDSDSSGVVEINDISAKYCADKHPDVISGKRSKEDILVEFLSTFDTIDKDGKVTPAEFIKYYGNVSSSIDDDDYFELMIRNAWHISGGEGWCANSSNMRVLVGHTEGHATVEEVKNDLGITSDDKEKIVAALVSQGISDIEYIQGNDGVKYTPGTTQPAKADSAPTTPTRGKRVPEESFLRPTTAPAPTAGPTNSRRHNGRGQSTLQLF